MRMRNYHNKKWNKRPYKKNYPDFYSKMTNNCGKLLDNRFSRGRFIYQRNRQSNLCYYLTEMKGNWIRSYRIRWITKSGETKSVYLMSLLGSNEPVFQEKTLIVKTPINQTEEHYRLFQDLTPDLEWFYDPEEDETYEVVSNGFGIVDEVGDGDIKYDLWSI